ncbi:hypothetical protein AC579_5406 [Pseudocercospora musae]|uniref:Dicer-like protein 2 n=1 Tax=Pseudocercospora musae TaxID=113226 RepID=A0A139I1N4_9PEZI|nr:hypothetical protein AC579_5406 [Pseudocercospora musae]
MSSEHPHGRTAQTSYTSSQGIRLRSYQTEMLEASLQKNVIVAMDTGSGKTHIAVARIRLELERNDKLIWFLTPSKTLAEQQYHVLSAELSAYGVRLLTGADGCEKWSDRRLWSASLANIRVVVATPAILLDALTHAFMHMARLALCVFDEAHHCTKKHPMSSIMKLFYHPARERGESVPHILGLSASPVVSSKEGMLQAIESNLNAVTITPKQYRRELETFVHPPEVQNIVYTAPSDAPPGRLATALTDLARTYDLSTDPYVLELTEQDDEKSRKELEKTMMKRKTYCLDQLRALDIRAGFLLEQLGASMADWYVVACIRRFRSGLMSDCVVLPDLSEKEREHLARIFDRMLELAPATPDANRPDVTAKATELMKILVTHANPSLRCIIFVEQRVLVTVLAEWLRGVSELKDQYQIAAFVGTSTSTNRKISVADLVTLQDQTRDLEAFRCGEKNLMIATNVLEEGIDISACNLVICFDPPKNLVSFVQRRGRARQQHSKYFIFSKANDSGKANPWALLEAELKRLYSDDTRQLCEALESHLDKESKIYQVQSTQAVLTLDNAKSHLYHFCSVCISKAAGYVDLRPEFDTVQNHKTRLWTATVYLPAFVHPDLRSASSAESWSREDLSIKSAAFEACVALHKAGLLNDNLLPPFHEHEESGNDCQRSDHSTLVQGSNRLSAWQRLCLRSQSLTSWSRWEVILESKDTVIVNMDMWLPFMAVTESQAFKLHWNEETEYTARISPHSKTLHYLDAQQLDSLRRCTALVLQSVHSGRMTSKDNDFPILFQPQNIQGLDKWLLDFGGQDATIPFGSSAQSAGLVHVKSQPGRLFFLRSVSRAENEDRVLLTPFPKRKDFLHPVLATKTTTMAYTSVESVPASECTVDRMPARYALFAAFAPSIMHRLDVTSTAALLRTGILKDIDVKDADLVLSALCSPSAGESTDYNRLEYLGDQVLKHCAEIQVMAQHLKRPEAFLTSQRDKIVRNSTLAKAALQASLDEFIVSKPFTGAKWRPLLLSEMSGLDCGKREISTKTLADVVESLIGAAYLDGGMVKGLGCIKLLLPNEAWHPLPYCFDLLLSDLSPAAIHGLSLLERMIGHEFEHKQLLVEAITHVSCHYNKNGLSYERLEFLGDSVLDLVVTPRLFAHKRLLRHWELHQAHEALVNKYFLGYCCMNYAIEQDETEIVADADGSYKAILKLRKVHLHDFLRANAQTTQMRRLSVSKFEDLASRIAEGLQGGPNYPWSELVTLAPPKFFSDMVESVLGALYIDSRGDLGVCEDFVERLGIVQYMQRILDDHIDCLHPKERIGILADQESVRYSSKRLEAEGGGAKSWMCTIEVGGTKILAIDGCASKEEGEVKAADQACKVLEGRDAQLARTRKRKLEDRISTRPEHKAGKQAVNAG